MSQGRLITNHLNKIRNIHGIRKDKLENTNFVREKKDEEQHWSDLVRSVMNYVENIQTYKAAGNSLLRAANKKNEKGNIPDPTVDNHDAFTFPIFFVLFLYFSPSINHAGPIIVFASSICFLAACIFPLFLDTPPTIQHHLSVNSSLTHSRISIFHFTCIFQMYLVFDHKK